MYTDIKMRLLRPVVAKALFFSLLPILLGQFVYTLFFFSPLTPHHMTAQHQQTSSSLTKRQMIKALNVALFGAYLPKNLNDSDVKKSMLNLTVVGIMYAGRDEESLVIIQTSAGKALTFHLGDTVPGGAVIKKIVPDGVFVEHNGALESLSLPKKQLNFEPLPKPLNIH